MSRGKGTLLIRINGQTMAFRGGIKSKSLKIALIFSDLPIKKRHKKLIYLLTQPVLLLYLNRFYRVVLPQPKL